MTTVFIEPLLSPRDRRDGRARGRRATAVLNPLEGLTEEELARGRGLPLGDAGEPRGAAGGARMPVRPSSSSRASPSPTGRASPCWPTSTLRRPRGEFVAIAGPNGGGKTTLIRLVVGLGTAGRRVACASSASPRTAVARRATLAYVPQRARLGGEGPITVRELVSAGRLAHGGLLGAAARPRPGDRRGRDRRRRARRARRRPAAHDALRRPAAARLHRQGARRASRRCSSWTSRPPVSTRTRRSARSRCSTASTASGA